MIISHSSPSAPARIESERDAAITAGFEWPENSSVFYQTDPTSVGLVTGRVGKILAYKEVNGVDYPDFVWRDTTNTNNNFTAAEFLEFAMAMDSFVEEQYVISWTKKAALGGS